MSLFRRCYLCGYEDLQGMLVFMWPLSRATLECLIEGGIGIVGGLEKSY